MFATARNLINFVSADIIYGDSTSYTWPTQFTQLYTLHAMVDNIMYPLVFGLLPGKSEEIYDRYSNLPKTTCQQHQLHMQTSSPPSRQLHVILHERSHMPLRITASSTILNAKKDTTTWIHHRLQRQRQCQTIRKTNSNIIFFYLYTKKSKVGETWTNRIKYDPTVI